MRSLALVGATASGKTALSFELAQRLGAEIISMDSRQVYRGMDIGTDKASPKDRRGIPHHGLDLITPSERYSAGQFARDARRWIAEIQKRGRLPLLVGGTGFFLRALTEPIFSEPEMDGARREALGRILEDMTPETRVQWVRRLDPERAPVAEAGGRQRILRSLEVALLTGRPLSWHHRHACPEAPAEPLSVVWLRVPRPLLNQRIEHRVHRMFEGGLLAEVDRLLRSGVNLSSPGMSGTGYQEAAAVLLGELSLTEAVTHVIQRTRQYARRQETWFRHQLPPEQTYTLDGTLALDRQADAVLSYWAQQQEGLQG